MEELELQEKPGFFSKVSSMFRGREDEEEEEVTEESRSASTYVVKAAHRYHVSVRRHIVSFDDAYAAANGLRRGEQQVLNLTLTDPVLRQKIVDFMAGVSFAQDANWEELGEHIYLVAPASAYVEQVASDAPMPQRFTGSFFSN
jgi:cell division inhibitor SepF